MSTAMATPGHDVSRAPRLQETRFLRHKCQSDLSESIPHPIPNTHRREKANWRGLPAQALTRLRRGWGRLLGRGLEGAGRRKGGAAWAGRQSLLESWVSNPPASFSFLLRSPCSFSTMNATLGECLAQTLCQRPNPQLASSSYRVRCCVVRACTLEVSTSRDFPHRNSPGTKYGYVWVMVSKAFPGSNFKGN